MNNMSLTERFQTIQQQREQKRVQQVQQLASAMQFLSKVKEREEQEIETKALVEYQFSAYNIPREKQDEIRKMPIGTQTNAVNVWRVGHGIEKQEQIDTVATESFRAIVDAYFERNKHYITEDKMEEQRQILETQARIGRDPSQTISSFEYEIKQEHADNYKIRTAEELYGISEQGVRGYAKRHGTSISDTVDLLIQMSQTEQELVKAQIESFSDALEDYMKSNEFKDYDKRYREVAQTRRRFRILETHNDWDVDINEETGNTEYRVRIDGIMVGYHDGNFYKLTRRREDEPKSPEFGEAWNAEYITEDREPRLVLQSTMDKLLDYVREYDEYVRTEASVEQEYRMVIAPTLSALGVNVNVASLDIISAGVEILNMKHPDLNDIDNYIQDLREFEKHISLGKQRYEMYYQSTPGLTGNADKDIAIIRKKIRELESEKVRFEQDKAEMIYDTIRTDTERNTDAEPTPQRILNQ